MYSPRGSISAAALEQATLRLTHRGSDGQRTWIFRDRRVGLGHARLSIIDLATGERRIRKRGLLTEFVSDSCPDHHMDGGSRRVGTG